MHREYQPIAHDHHGPVHTGRRWPWMAVLLGLLAAAYVASGFYQVQPNERAVVRRCGRVLPELREPGLHFGYPYGIDRVDRIKRAEEKRVGVGIELTGRALGRRAQPQQAEALAGDRNLIVISAIVQYRIRDEQAYLFHVDDVPALIENAAASALASVVAAMTVDDVLTVRRSTIQDRVKLASQGILDRCEAGVEVTAVSLQDAAPPQEVAHAFRDVTAAREDRQRTINEAQGYANRVLPEARGQARRISLEAEAYATEVARKAEGDAQRFSAMAAEAAGDRKLTGRRLILETLEAVLPRVEKIVVDDPRQVLDLGIFEEKR